MRHALRHRTLYTHFLPTQCCDVPVSQFAIEFDQRPNPTTEFPPENLSYDSQNPNGRGASCQAARLAPRPKADRASASPQNTLHAHARARPLSQHLLFFGSRRLTGRRFDRSSRSALRCRNISQGLIGMGSMPLRYQLHIYFPRARCRRWFRQCCHTKREERKGRVAGNSLRQGVEDARHTHTHPRTQPRPHLDRQATGQKCKCNREEKVMRRPARIPGCIGTNMLGVLQTHTRI